MGEKRGVEGAALGLSKESQHSNYQGSPKISFICVLNKGGGSFLINLYIYLDYEFMLFVCFLSPGRIPTSWHEYLQCQWSDKWCPSSHLRNVLWCAERASICGQHNFARLQRRNNQKSLYFDVRPHPQVDGTIIISIFFALSSSSSL